MLAVIGIAVVFLAVFGGFLMEQGNPWVLMQPAELLIVGGAAVGIILVANPPALIRKMVRGARDAFREAAYGRQVFLLHLRMLYEVFGYVQRAGIVALESDVENPARSPIFSRYPGFLRDAETRNLVCDSLRMMVIGATTPQELDQLMDLDIDVQRRGRHEPVSALSTVADALPGLGIVAAVLGVVITMQAIGGSPETVGQKVAAALVGTFLGILLCYGVVGPVAARLENMGEAQAQFLQVLRVALVAFFRGAAPILAVEYARRSIPVEVRPSFLALETAIRRDAKIPPIAKPGDEAHPPGEISADGHPAEPAQTA
jgi:chemotaxis protein MotA